jgi:hypothetical protein
MRFFTNPFVPLTVNVIAGLYDIMISAPKWLLSVALMGCVISLSIIEIEEVCRRRKGLSKS